MVIQCSGFFVHAIGSIQELVTVIGVIGRVFSHLKLYKKHDNPQTARQDVPLEISCVNNKMRKTLGLKILYKGTYTSCQYIISVLKNNVQNCTKHIKSKPLKR